MSICIKDKTEVDMRVARIKKLLDAKKCNLYKCIYNINGGDCDFIVGVSSTHIPNCPKNYNKL